ncbi:MAG TPA: NIPSNAP family protein [Rhizobium sp.]
MIYDVTILGLKPNTYGKVLPLLPEGISSDIREGKFLGSLWCEFGILNRALILSVYETVEALHADRAAVADGNPFGVGEHLNFIERTAYKPLSFMPDIELGSYGPFYEVRSYEVAAGGMQETADAWSKVVEERQGISKLLMVMAAIEGAPQRLLHLWPYKTLNDRTSARAEASSRGFWPPPGSSTHLLSLKSELFSAMKFSPLS